MNQKTTGTLRDKWIKEVIIGNSIKYKWLIDIGKWSIQ